MILRSSRLRLIKKTRKKLWWMRNLSKLIKSSQSLKTSRRKNL